IDSEMKAMDGLALAKVIKSDARLKSAKLLLLTSVRQATRYETLRANGIDAGLPKPVKPAQLFEALVNLATNKPQFHELAKPADRSPVHAAVTATTIVSRSERILLVEDNTVNQRLTQAQLERLGYNADIAGNGLEALEMLKHGDYRLILLDCQMPEMDGFA